MRNLIYKMVFDGVEMEIAFPLVTERIMILEMLVANDVAVHSADVYWVVNDLVKVVPMTAHEMSWFCRL